MKTVKYLVLAFLLLAVMAGTGLAQTNTFPVQASVQVWLPPISTTNTSAWYDLSNAPTSNMGVHYWTLDWYALTEFGTIPTCAIKAQKNTIKSESGISDLVAAQTCTSTGVTSTSVSANTNFVRINLTTKTGSGKIVAVLRGYFQDPAGTINVSVVSGSTGNAAASNTGAAVPAQADYQGLNIGGTLRGQTGTNTSGVIYAADINCVQGCTGGTTDTDDGTVAGGQSTGLSIGLSYVWNGSNWVRQIIGTAGSPSAQVTSVQGISGGTPTPVAYGDGTPVLSTDVASVASGTAPVSTMNSSSSAGGVNASMACVFDDASPTALTENNFGYLRCSTNRNAYTTLRDAAGNERGANVNAANGLTVTLVPDIAAGYTPFNNTGGDAASACSTTPLAVKAGQGVLGFFYVNNPNTADSWVHFYNTASGSVTVGTTVPVMSFHIPGVASNSVGGVIPIPVGIQFSTAITMACTTTAGGNTAPSNALEVTGGIK